MTRDPIGYEGGINLYAFCAGNPINNTDPFGTQNDKPWWSFIGDWYWNFEERVGGWFNATVNKTTFQKGTPTLGNLRHPELDAIRDIVGETSQERLGQAGRPIGQFTNYATGTLLTAVVPATFDKVYQQKAHTLGGIGVQRDIRRGRAAFVFNDDVDLDALAQKVWTEGEYLGYFRDHDRFVWRSPVPIGRRIQAEKPDLPLHWVEIKVNAQGKYHLDPRSRPAAP